MKGLAEFVVESNRIEGIDGIRPVEIEAHERLLTLDLLTVEAVEAFVWDVAEAKLRDQIGMDVRVGAHLPPGGAPGMRDDLHYLLGKISDDDALTSSYEAHVEYEQLHPFMDGNGRSGRAIWAWQMRREGHDPFALPFLHRFYYQALDASR